MSRIGLGCMRLSTDPERDPTRAAATISAALEHGMTWLDTARAYGRDDSDAGHNERLIAAVLASHASYAGATRVVTKCGMARPDGRWQPDGRASTILADAEASGVALGRPPDVLLLHAPDPNVALASSVRALLRAREAGLARAIGLSNVTRGQLDALGGDAAGAVAAVEVALGAFDDGPARGGVVAWCRERGAVLLAHSPFGGPGRAARLGRDPTLGAVAEKLHATVHEIVLAYLLAIDPSIVPIPGARSPEAAASAARASQIVLDDDALASLDARFPGLALARRPPRSPPAHSAKAEVVILMGLAGSGKTRHAEAWVGRGYERLNRDLIGGTLRGLAQHLARVLAGGATRVVLDNTYLTRASRSEVVRVAHAAAAVVRCVHVDTPPHEVQVNVVGRMLERHGALLGGSELVKRSKGDPNLFAPSAFYRMQRELERPSPDEGFAAVETIPFAREHLGDQPSVAVPLELVLDLGPELALRDPRPAAAALATAGPVLLFGWRPGADDAWLVRATALARELLLPSRPLLEVSVCAHGSGPPVCWCRPPLPGLWVAFARKHGVDPRRSALVATTSAHRSLAKALGVRVVTL
jgi:aryl-alcohol dehydrogenase-like predicted oxidoreductase